MDYKDRSVIFFKFILLINSEIEFFEFASLTGLLLYSIWSRLWLSIKALVV
jgi:hypothetical protein